MHVDVVAQRVGTAVEYTLRRLATVAGVLAVTAALVGAATFATGWWVFHDSRTAWAVIGGAMCLVPALAGLGAWAFVRAAAHLTPRLVTDISAFVATPSPSAQLLIDYDSGQPIASNARSMNSMKADVGARKRDLPALYLGVRAITIVPALAAVALVGIVLLGGLGTVLLIVGLAS